MRKVIVTLFLMSSMAIAQQQSNPKLSEAEALTLKTGILEQQLAEAQAKIASLNQQIALYATYQNHGWKKDEVAIQMNRDGLPEAVAKPEIKK